MSIFSKEALAKRKYNTAKALNDIISDNDIVVVKAGDPIQVPGGHDQTYQFRPHPDYYWLTGNRREAGISAYSKKDGWVDFVKPISRSERIWEGIEEEISGKNINEFDSFSRGKNIIELAQGSKIEHNIEVQEAFNKIRRVKDQEEVALIKRAAGIANVGYKRVEELIRENKVVGLSERELQLEYEYAVLKAGSNKLPYETIVGSGTRSAILHATPTQKIIKSDDLILIDAGADVYEYCVDVTRVYSAQNQFTTQQKELYKLVQKAQAASIEKCVKNTIWADVHLASAQVFAQGLIDFNLIKCTASDAIESSLIAIFFPHGVGHMVGLKVRDVGGPVGIIPKDIAGIKLRSEITLDHGHIMTVEPGLYFIEALLKDNDTKEKYKDLINWGELEKWIPIGGIRLEDDILVTSDGPENLTKDIVKQL